jgi:hypothetical protein
MPEASGPTPEAIAWRVHPAVERPGRGALVLALVVVLSVLVGLWMRGPYWSAFAFAVLFLSLEAFFLPSRFELREQGVVVRKPFSQATRPWGEFRRVVFDPFGVTLSPFGRRHWLDPYRGVRLRFASGVTQPGMPGHDEVRRYIRAHVDAGRVRIEDFEGARSDRSEAQGPERGGRSSGSAGQERG